MSASQRISRRSALKAGSAGLTVWAAGLASSSTRWLRTARAAERVSGANDRLVFGVIGLGSMGSGHVKHLLELAPDENLDLPVLCDVYNKRVQRQAARCQATALTDYRRVLDNKDINCVVVATPDHWHFKNAMDALQAGKHVYLQKPMVHTIEQTIKLRNRVRRAKDMVVQIGTQATANWRYWAANALIRKRTIGDVLWSQASYSRNNPRGEWNYPIDEHAGPHASGEDHIDWDMWLGHEFGCAPKTDWNPEHFFRFRKYWAYSGGIATDLFYHKLAPILLAIEGPGGANPLRVSAGGGIYVQKDGREVPDTFAVTIDYPGEHTIVLTSSMANDDTPPERIRGQFGTIDLGGKVTTQKPWSKEFRAQTDGRDEIELEPPADWNEERRGKGHLGHLRNFIDVIRGRQTQLNCGIELAAATQIAITMSVMAYRQQQTLTWDNFNERAQAG